MLCAPPSGPATHPAASETPPVYDGSNARKSDVVAGSVIGDSFAPLAFARSVGVYRSQRNVLMRAGSPGPGAVTMLGRPETASTRPVASVTPDLDPGEGAKVVITSGAWPADRCDENTLTCESVPGPAPTMMLSDRPFPSMSAPATLTPPRKSALKGEQRAISV